MKLPVGKISRHFYVHCGILTCSTEAQDANVGFDYFLKNLVKFGWKKTKKEGWVCPKCNQNKMDNKEDPEG